jgi:hypothetical protein
MFSVLDLGSRIRCFVRPLPLFYPQIIFSQALYHSNEGVLAYQIPSLAPTLTGLTPNMLYDGIAPPQHNRGSTVAALPIPEGEC